ncbi:hypothetical protein PybrP1_003314 [[Pythium] brassicae (nom. inval.)]|nr:hypothetical protein PybrP1_003314 [[Pythium] brassicae (nom. inval.)]
MTAPRLDHTALSPLTRAELQRYGRQMLVSDLGVERQLRLRRASVLVLGVGGLGSPVALYLAAMGVGRLGLVDDDRVERSNLHRQVAHDESSIGELKVRSAQRRIASLNPDAHIEAIATRFTAANALALVARFDIVVDASDNVATRYLANDACAAEGKPLVSGSALGLEGQVTVFPLHDPAHQGGCYRCLYPKPQPSAAAMSCAENGVVGVVPGVIGCLQAMETVKVITGLGKPLVGVQCFYDAYDGQFRHLKIGHRRRSDCSACSASARLNRQLRAEELLCAADDLPPELPAEHRVSVHEFAALRSESTNLYTLLDTRSRSQFDMVHFPEAVHIPFERLRSAHARDWTSLRALVEPALPAPVREQPPETRRTLVVCRRGIDSAFVTQWLIDSGVATVANVDGGYEAYAQQVDPTFPMY